MIVIEVFARGSKQQVNARSETSARLITSALIFRCGMYCGRPLAASAAERATRLTSQQAESRLAEVKPKSRRPLYLQLHFIVPQIRTSACGLT